MGVFMTGCLCHDLDVSNAGPCLYCRTWWLVTAPTYRHFDRRSVQTSSWRQTATSRGCRWPSSAARAPSTSSIFLSTSRTAQCSSRLGPTTAHRSQHLMSSLWVLYTLSASNYCSLYSTVCIGQLKAKFNSLSYNICFKFIMITFLKIHIRHMLCPTTTEFSSPHNTLALPLDCPVNRKTAIFVVFTSLLLVYYSFS